MAANILVRDFRIPFADTYSIDISVDTHVKRLFGRLGLASLEGSPEQVSLRITYKARALNPEYPVFFHLSLWGLGRSVCKESNPRCAECELRPYCEFGTRRTE